MRFVYCDCKYVLICLKEYFIVKNKIFNFKKYTSNKYYRSTFSIKNVNYHTRRVQNLFLLKKYF